LNLKDAQVVRYTDRRITSGSRSAACGRLPPLHFHKVSQGKRRTACSLASSLALGSSLELAVVNPGTLDAIGVRQLKKEGWGESKTAAT
jgi:hypothetical protein